MTVLAWWTPEGRWLAILEALRQLEGIKLLAAVARCLGCEGWRVEVDGTQVKIWDNGTVYERDYEWLLGCDYSDLPTGLANDLLDVVRSEGGCT